MLEATNYLVMFCISMFSGKDLHCHYIISSLMLNFTTFNAFLASVVLKKVASHQHFSTIFHKTSMNVQYLNMQYVKRENRASVVNKKQQQQQHFVLTTSRLDSE